MASRLKAWELHPKHLNLPFQVCLELGLLTDPRHPNTHILVGLLKREMLVPLSFVTFGAFFVYMNETDKYLKY